MLKTSLYLQASNEVDSIVEKIKTYLKRQIKVDNVKVEKNNVLVEITAKIDNYVNPKPILNFIHQNSNNLFKDISVNSENTELTIDLKLSTNKRAFNNLKYEIAYKKTVNKLKDVKKTLDEKMERFKKKEEDFKDMFDEHMNDENNVGDLTEFRKSLDYFVN